MAPGQRTILLLLQEVYNAITLGLQAKTALVESRPEASASIEGFG